MRAFVAIALCRPSYPARCYVVSVHGANNTKKSLPNLSDSLWARWENQSPQITLRLTKKTESRATVSGGPTA